MADVHILMLGGTGSGKTCFVLGMYEDMRYGRDGFSLSAVDPNVDRDLSEKWVAFESGRGDTRWPAPTDAREDFELSFNYALRQFMTFNWTDYPGGALYTAHHRALRDELQDELTRSAGILVCLPGGQLFDFLEKGKRALRSLNVADVNQMLAHLQEMYAAGVKPAVSIVVTKFDEFVSRVAQCRADGALATKFRNLDIQQSGDDLDDLECAELLMESAVMNAFSVLFAPGGGWQVLICPVTLGMDLMNEVEGDAEINIVNMHLPVLFTFLEYQRRLRQEWEAAQCSHRQRVVRLEGQLLRWFRKQGRNDASRSLAEVEERLKLFESRAAVVEQRMPKDTIIFNNGDRVSGSSRV